MAVNLTYFVHATTDDNLNRISSGWNDVALSELGRRQAITLRRHTRDMEFNAALCSDLKRAHDTASLVWGGLCEIIPDPRLRECNYGDLNGASSDIVEPMQVAEHVARPFPNGESYEDVRARLAAFLAFLTRNYDGKHVAVVGHKAPQLALDVLLKGMTWEQAIAEDWRRTGAWRPGWVYVLTDDQL